MTRPDPSSVSTLITHYSLTAHAYERWWASALEPASVRLLDRLPLAGAARVLDLGAGVGTLLAAIQCRAPSALVTASDRSPGMLRRADPRWPRILADAAALPFATGCFDVIVMAFMLFHLPDPGSCLREVRRVARTGGCIGLATWGQGVTAPAVRIWTEELDRQDAPPADPTVSQHELTDSPEKMRSLLSGAGFASATAEVVAWSHRPTMDEFVARVTTMGVGGRRFSQLSRQAQDEVVRRGRHRLGELAADDFADHSEVVLTTALA